MYLLGVQEDIAEKGTQELSRSWEGPRTPERALKMREEEGFPGREGDQEEGAGVGQGTRETSVGGQSHQARKQAGKPRAGLHF